MKNIKLISQKTLSSMEKFYYQAPKETRSSVDSAVNEIYAKAVPLSRKKDNNKSSFFSAIELILENKIGDKNLFERSLFRRCLIARLSIGFSDFVGDIDFPEEILTLYPEAFDRLAEHIQHNRDEPYDMLDDFFQKDISFALGVSIPCGAQMVELNSFFLMRSIIRAFFRPGNFKALIRFFMIGGNGPWFGIHTESRYLTDFNEAGWDACYFRIAQLLEVFPSVVGMKGTSWFYDPQLISISPHLAYLQQKPIERGGFLIRHGTTDIDIARATLTSKKRRMLHRDGKYFPVSYTLLWPRQEILKWAKDQHKSMTHNLERREPSVQ